MKHRVETHWHPQRCMVITSKVVIAIGLLVAAETASADVGSQQSEFDTLTGECTKVMLMDILTDPAVCSDQVTAIRSGNGTLGYAFTIDSQGNPKPWIISFSGANLRHENRNGGTNTFSVYKIYLTINGETDDLVGLGSCVLSNAYGDTPAKLVMLCFDDKGQFRWRIRHSPHWQRYVAELTGLLDAAFSALRASSGSDHDTASQFIVDVTIEARVVEFALALTIPRDRSTNAAPLRSDAPVIDQLTVREITEVSRHLFERHELPGLTVSRTRFPEAALGKTLESEWGVALHIESRKGTALSALLRATGFGRMCVLRLWRALLRL